MTVFGVYAYALFSVIPSGATKRRRAYLRRGNRAPAAVCMHKTFQSKCYFLLVKGLARTFRASRFVALGEIHSTRLCCLSSPPTLQVGMTTLYCTCANTPNNRLLCTMHQIDLSVSSLCLDTTHPPLRGPPSLTREGSLRPSFHQ